MKPLKWVDLLGIDPSFNDAPSHVDHRVSIIGMPGEGTMVHCSCGRFSEFDTAYAEDFDRLEALVLAHRRAEDVPPKDPMIRGQRAW